MSRPAEQRRIVHLLNSTYGRHGHIGFRTPFVVHYARNAGFEIDCLARDRGRGDSDVKQVLPFGDFIPRALNGVRIYLFPSFNHRNLDIFLFEKFSKTHLSEILQTTTGKETIIHLWDFAPGLIDFCHTYGVDVALEVPIAPSHEALRIQNAGVELDSEIEDPYWYEDEAIRKADYFLSPSPYVTEVLERIGVRSSRIHTNRFGCDPPNRLPQRSSSKEDLNFLFVGGISRRKGIPFLLEAWSEGPFQDDTLILCGRPRRHLSEELARLNLNNIHTPGHVDVEPYYREADVFVFPTLMEGCSKAVLEAMAWGLPVISTPHSGAPIRDGKDGTIIPPGSSEGLLRAMVDLKNDPAERRQLGNAARETAKDFTWQRYGRGVVQAYEEILKGDI